MRVSRPTLYNALMKTCMVMIDCAWEVRNAPQASMLHDAFGAPWHISPIGHSRKQVLVRWLQQYVDWGSQETIFSSDAIFVSFFFRFSSFGSWKGLRGSIPRWQKCSFYICRVLAILPLFFWTRLPTRPAGLLSQRWNNFLFFFLLLRAFCGLEFFITTVGGVIDLRPHD